MGLIFLMVMVRQFVSFQENATLFDQEQRRRRLAEALSQAARTLSTSLDYQAVPPLILDQLSLVVPYERCSIMLRQDKHLYIAAQRGFPADKRTTELRIEIKPDDTYLELESSRQPLVLPDVTRVAGWTIVPWLTLNKSWMGVPLESGKDVIGMISLTRREANAFTPEDASQALAFAGQAAVALENARLYQELSQAYRIVETLDRTKSRFIEIVAHELRTPLTVIKGYSQTLASLPSVKADPVSKPVLDGLQRGADRMYEIVNNMLDVTKIEYEVLQLHKEEIKVLDLFQRIANHFQKGLQERNLTLALERLEELPLIKADPSLMYKVFLQLVMNAIKYTPDGGKITVSGFLNLPTREVEVIISDTGIGIDPSQIELVFEKFYQTGQVELHSSSQTQFKGGGPGLGLPIARGIVVAHGGKIWAESAGCDEQGCPGSQFHIRLPV
jgi:signal transduction histidine kinase